jgi:spore maturation protein CgeB
MRALVVHPGPNFSVADVARGWARGLHALGIDVRTYELDKALDLFNRTHLEQDDGSFVRPWTEEQAVMLAAGQVKAACYDWWPDLVIVVSGFFMYPQLVEIMQARHRHVVLVCTESPYEDERQAQKAAWYDAVVINDPLNLDVFAEACDGPALYLPHCYDPVVHYPGASDIKSDVAFVGTGYPSRQRFLERVDWDGIDLLLGGNWKDAPESLTRYVGHDLERCVENEETASIYRGTSATFNIYRLETNGGLVDEADGIACGPREIEAAACGTWFARQSRQESDELFPMLPTFGSPEELGDVLRWALAHPEDRQSAADAARLAVSDRTFPNNARRLLTALGL